MLDPENYSFCSEFYAVEKAVIVIVNIAGIDRNVRIEALHRLDHPGFSTRSYINAPINDEDAPEEIRAWIDYPLPWTHGTQPMR